MVAFNAIPPNMIVPFFYAEINSGGSPYEGQSKLLLLGQKLSAGSAPANVPIIVNSEQDANALFGLGSMLVDMWRTARANAPFAPIWALPLADPAGAAAVGSATVVSAPGKTGVGLISVCGRRLPIAINAADTTAIIATSIRDAINNASPTLPVSASAATNVVTITARHVGAASNGLELRIRTEEPNLFTSSNLTIVGIGTGTAGTGVPTLTTALAGMGDDEFDWIAGPYTDTTSLDAIRDFLSDTGTGRWSPMKQLFGHYVSAAYGTLSALVTLGNARNDRHVSIVGMQTAPRPVWCLAAAVGAQAQAHLTDAPELSRPLQTLELKDILPPVDRSTWFDIAARQALYVDGVAATKHTYDGRVLIDRIVTTEQVTALGVPDTTFRDIETIAQMVFFARFMRTEVSNRHGRQGLASTNPAGLAEITTPRDVRNTLIHAYEALVALGVVENADLFAEFVVVERDANNANRLSAYLPVDVVNQLRVFAANITTFLQYAA